MLSGYPVVAVLPVVDIERAKAFYRDRLGLPALPEPLPGDEADFECGGGSRLRLYRRPPVAVEHTQATFEVDDIRAIVRELTARGVRFEQYDYEGFRTDADGIAEVAGVRGAWFKDTEGNILSVLQR
jgi:catechol 2,3-dioxygenase-like lactoylglutathione lyase family enzyme